VGEKAFSDHWEEEKCYSGAHDALQMALGFCWHTLKCPAPWPRECHQQAFIENYGWLTVRVMVKSQLRAGHLEAPGPHQRPSKGP